ncbi:MAG: family 3 adenylate cyclase [Magnetococcales bacterium]|nr:family 3 adenylate cyclase [Magnetococcales bacterium]
MGGGAKPSRRRWKVPLAQLERENIMAIVTGCDDDNEIFFADEEDPCVQCPEENADAEIFPWKIMIVDDEIALHQVTQLALESVIFDGRPLVFISAFTGKEAQDLLVQHPDTALIFLDVVMESEDAGLKVAEFVRKTLKNVTVRIVLRTGQPGQAPERDVITNYDINDYKEKSELTSQKLFTITISSLRSYRDIITIINEKKIVHAFSSYLAPELVDEIRKNPDSVKLSGEEKFLTCLFADIRNFTRLGEYLTPRQLVNLLNEILDPCTEIIIRNKGMLDKYIGDSLMALFNVPVAIDAHAHRALTAGFEIIHAVENMNYNMQQNNFPRIRMGVGIHSGVALVGNIGAATRFDYTAIGDTINTASRLEGLNKYYGTEILFSGTTKENLSSIPMQTLAIDRVFVKGKTDPVWIHAGFPTEIPEFEKISAEFTQGIDLYSKKNFRRAMDHLTKAQKLCPFRFIQEYLHRCQHLIEHPPTDDWTGIIQMQSK